jgi:protein-tyrosine sulfotransferase
MTRKPIFIGGMVRSGATLLRNMLGQHSAIAFGQDTNWYQWDWKRRLAPDMQLTLASLARYFDVNADDIRVLAQYLGSPEVFLAILMEELAMREGKERWVERAAGNVAHMDRIWRAFPEAQVIQITRDPRDIFASLLESRKCESISEFADTWAATIGASENLVKRLKPSSQSYMVVRYEDLVGAAEPTIRRIIDFLGERWEQVIVQKGKRSSRSTVDAEGHNATKFGVMKTAITDERVGIWRRILTDQDIAEMHRAVTDRGYGELYQRVLVAA